MKLRLDSTHHHGSRFLQYWTIIDDSGVEHQVVSDSEWGDVSIEEGGDRTFDVAGTPVRADQMVACAISCVPNPTEDGHECEINEAWLKAVEESGVDREWLSHSVSGH